MKIRTPLAWLLTLILLAGCDVVGQSGARATIEELTAENERLQHEYDQLRSRVEALDEDLRTTGFLEPQVIVEPVTFAEGGNTLQRVLDRGVLRCGVNINAPGLGYLDTETGDVAGFDIDFCRALAAAIFGAEGADQFEPVPLTSRTRFPALGSILPRLPFLMRRA